MSEQAQTPSQPQVIQLNGTNSVQILLQYIDVAQKNGTFLLPESDLLKRCRDFLLNAAEDAELTLRKARECLIQAINKGQSKGSYSLDDASILFKVCQYVSQNLDDKIVAQPPQVQEQEQENSDDLSSLSDPVPIKPRVV